MRRDAAQTIFRTVVFAGAMLGAGACGKKPAPVTPTNTMESGQGTDPAMKKDEDPAAGKDPAADPCAGASNDPCAGASDDPCAGGERPRGVDDDGGGGVGRGFILS